MKKYLFIAALLLPVLLMTAFSQGLGGGLDKAKILQMLQSGGFGNMSPAEILDKIKAAGISQDEIMGYAKQMNVDISKYLPASTLIDTTGTKAFQVSAPALRKPILFVPSFTARLDSSQLKPYGYELFQNVQTSFEPVINAPTPSSYRIGPADVLVVNVWGQTQLNYELDVTRDGYVVMPDIGKVTVGGLTIDQVRQRLLDRMTKVYEGLKNGKPGANTFLDVSLDKIRTIQVYVLGNVQMPGGYSLNGLSTVFTALYYAGGPNVDGSLRDIHIIRGDSVIEKIDIYNYILFGRRANDVRLEDGDAVFIPPAGKRVAIRGAVRDTAVFELKPGETLHDLMEMAGGLLFSAYDRRIHIDRIIPFQERSKYKNNILDLDVGFADQNALMSSGYTLEDGDIVSVLSVNQVRENLVTIMGNVRKPGRYEVLPGMRLNDLVNKADGYLEDTFLDHASLVRIQPNLNKEIITFVPRLAIEGDTIQNIALQRLDSVMIYTEEFFRHIDSVTIDGAVRNPGKFKRTEHLTVRNLIVLAGGLRDGADLSNIEVSRLDTTGTKQMTRVYHISLPREYWKENIPNDFELMDFDNVSVRIKPEFSYLKNVEVLGEARYPGTYIIEYEGEKISDLIRRFGGFKPTAYLEGVRFLRSTGVAGISRPSPDVLESPPLDTAALKLYQLFYKPRYASREVPIEIQKVLKDTSSLDNLELQMGDTLIVPRDPGVVYVEGQVYVPSSVPYKERSSIDYYLKQAGGVRTEADEDNIVVVLPNGKKWESGEIISGSTIIAPLKIEIPSKNLEIIREWMTIALSTTTLAYIVWQVSKK